MLDRHAPAGLAMTELSGEDYQTAD